MVKLLFNKHEFLQFLTFISMVLLWRTHGTTFQYDQPHSNVIPMRSPQFVGINIHVCTYNIINMCVSKLCTFYLITNQIELINPIYQIVKSNQLNSVQTSISCTWVMWGGNFISCTLYLWYAIFIIILINVGYWMK